MTAINTLVSKLAVDRGQSEIVSSNIASAEVDGYVRKEVMPVTVSTAENLGGVKLSPVYNAIDESLRFETRRENSNYSMQQAINDYYVHVNLLFGSKGEQAAFAHNFGKFVEGMSLITNNSEITNKQTVINKAISFAKQISDVTMHINENRASVDQELGNCVASLNELVDEIAELNKRISTLAPSNTSGPDGGAYIDITSLENERDLCIQKLTGLVKVDVYTSKNNKVNISLSGSGQTLVQGNNSYHLDYTPSASVSPGQVLSAVSRLGTDITNTIEGGRIAGLIQMRDTVFPNMQAEFDEFVRVTRDTVNELHNQGSAFNGSSTLTGTDSVPGLVGPLNAATVISGQGILRIAVLDNQGNAIDYKDVSLMDNMTVGGLIANINAANYVNSAAAVPLTGGDLLVSQLPSGALEVSSTAGHTIAIGSQGGQSKISLGATYDPTTGLGVSHFLGLNNFFVTGNLLASSSAQIGIANQLTVRSDLQSNPSNLSVGTLNSDTTIPLSSVSLGAALGSQKTDVAEKIATQLENGNLHFLAAGPLDSVNMSAISYATRVMATIQGEISTADAKVNLHRASYDQFAKLAAEKSSVDPAEELVKIYNISTSQNITTKALSIVLEMNKAIINLL